MTEQEAKAKAEELVDKIALEYATVGDFQEDARYNWRDRWKALKPAITQALLDASASGDGEIERLKADMLYCGKLAAEDASALRAQLESCQAALADPPPDVQEMVIKKLDLVSRDAIKDEIANAQHSLLARFDARAAESTDLYTWILCQQARLEALQKELDDQRTHMSAWYSVFDTTQLSHAQARLEAAEKRAVDALTALAEFKSQAAKKDES